MATEADLPTEKPKARQMARGEQERKREREREKGKQDSVFVARVSNKNELLDNTHTQIEMHTRRERQSSHTSAL
jgi:hypothetical protein